MNEELSADLDEIFARLSGDEYAPVPMSDEDIEVQYVEEWANKIATEDNDLIYLRKKNGIMYVMKAEPHKAGKWEKLNPNAKPVYVDPHGLKLAPELAPEGVEIPVEKKLKPIPNIPQGWYQDDKANLYYYSGTGMWDADMKDWGKLLNKAESGELEYLG
jgi:hypothetical protein